MTKKFYSFLSLEKQKDFSLNFLLAEKLPDNPSCYDIRGIEKKAESILHGSRDFACGPFNKYISRYLHVSADDNFIREQI